MIGVILGLAPLGLGIALNPVAIVVGILVVRRPDPQRNGVAFVLAWVAGLALLVLLSAWLLPKRADHRPFLPPALAPWIWIAIGTLLLLGAAHAWRTRPRSSESAEERRWAVILGQGGTLRTVGVGLFLSMVSVRNLALLAAAAAMLGQAGLTVLEFVVAAASFLAVSSLGVAIPLVVRLIGGPRADAALDRAARWLTQHLSAITAGVMGVIGLYLLDRGIAALMLTAR